jgi:hypothetical protein
MSDIKPVGILTPQRIYQSVAKQRKNGAIYDGHIVEGVS